MELKVVTKPIEVVIGDKEKFGFKFKQPSYIEINRFRSCVDDAQLIEAVNSLFIEFIKKPNLVDEDGKEIKCDNFKDFMELNISISLLQEVLITVANKFKEVLQDRTELEKK